MIIIPAKFDSILNSDLKYKAIVLEASGNFSEILMSNNLYFFEEYTDHGIKHIQQVLFSAEEIISDHTLNNFLSPKDVCALILSIFLHDIGMHTSFFTFKNLLEGKYDDAIINGFDSKKWIELWKEYLEETKRFNGKQKLDLFGDSDYIVNDIQTYRKEDLNTKDIKFIGEFLRRSHPRIAHEIALHGLITVNDDVLFICGNQIENEYADVIGVLARSHGIEVRSTFGYLSRISEEFWSVPYNVNVIFLMIVLRVSDYFQIDASRVSTINIKLNKFISPLSELEHKKHISIKFLKPSLKDSETLIVEANAGSVKIYLELKNLFENIQRELDTSWAILGEIYGKNSDENKPYIKFRRIKSNLESDVFIHKQKYVNQALFFDADKDLLKLLIAPLYGGKPTFAIRELLQNSVDACRERQVIEGKYYMPLVDISIERDLAGQACFTIVDNGKGMSFLELKKYFFRAGASFRKSYEWNNSFLNEAGKPLLFRTGRFGVGVLASFLLGEKIYVETKSLKEKQGYKFETNIDLELTEVLKADEIEYGTKIKININDEILSILINDKVIKQLENDDDNNETPTINHWHKWFTLSKPEVKITILNNLAFTPYKKFEPDLTIEEDLNWRYFDIEEFGRIGWTYSRKYINCKLTCNGFFIPSGYQFNHPIIIKAPKISVFDYYGKLNLNLNRNSLNGGILPFEKNLVKEIYKDIIRQLLLMDTPVIEHNGIFTVSKNIRFNYPGIDPVNILFHSKGYIPSFKMLSKDLSNYFQLDLVIKEDEIVKFSLPEDKYLLNIQYLSSKTKLVEELLEKFKTVSMKDISDVEILERVLSNEPKKNKILSYNIAIIQENEIGDEYADFVQCFEIFKRDFFIPYNKDERKAKFKMIYDWLGLE